MSAERPYQAHWYTGWVLCLAILFGMSVPMLLWVDYLAKANDPTHLGLHPVVVALAGWCAAVALVMSIARLTRSRFSPLISLACTGLMLPCHVFSLPGFFWMWKEYRKERDALSDAIQDGEAP